MKNPFIAGNWVRAERFFGRGPLLHDILDGKYSYVWIAGTRRLGKTSLLKQIEYLCEQPKFSGRYIALFWNMQGAGDLDGMAESLLESVEDAEERFGEIGVTADELEGKSLFEMLRGLKRAARQANRILLLLCDECEELLNVEKHNPEALPRLRRFFQQGENVIAVIAATKRLLKLEADGESNTSPFLHGFTPPVYLQKLDDAAAETLIRQGKFAPNAIAEIKEKCGNHPYLIQLLCSRFFENRDLKAVVREMSLDDAVAHFFAVDFDYLEPKEKVILWHVLNEGKLTAAELIRKTAIEAESLAATLQSLVQLGYLRRDGKRVRIANYFFEKWLRREKDRLFAAVFENGNHPQNGKNLQIGRLAQHSFIGKMISHYRIETELGSGGMGWVFKALDDRLQRAVALKMLSPTLLKDASSRERFFVEARAAAALSHPNIATIYEIDETDGLLFIAMEFIAGTTLGKWGAAHPDLSIRKNIARQIAEGVQFAHSQNIVHRDLKPDNIMVTAENRVKITDFGLAKILRNASQKLTQTGTSMGTPAYMAPEQIGGGEIDRRTDIFSLGVVFFELFTGKLPYEAANEAALIYSLMHDAPRDAKTIQPDLPDELAELFAQMLKKSPDDRVRDLNTVIKQLENQ